MLQELLPCLLNVGSTGQRKKLNIELTTEKCVRVDVMNQQPKVVVPPSVECQELNLCLLTIISV